jgi:hypothetical protein
MAAFAEPVAKAKPQSRASKVRIFMNVLPSSQFGLYRVFEATIGRRA